MSLPQAKLAPHRPPGGRRYCTFLLPTTVPGSEHTSFLGKSERKTPRSSWICVFLWNPETPRSRKGVFSGFKPPTASVDGSGSAPRHPGQASEQPGAQLRGSELTTASPASRGVAGVLPNIRPCPRLGHAWLPLVFTDAESTSVDIPETFFAGAMRRARPASAIRVSDEGFEAAKCN